MTRLIISRTRPVTIPAADQLALWPEHRFVPAIAPVRCPHCDGVLFDETFGSRAEPIYLCGTANCALTLYVFRDGELHEYDRITES